MPRNLMEEKQLDFNAPLMSVRRFASSGVSASDKEEGKRVENSLPKRSYLPPYKPELTSGPLRNPGAVPFLWEQIPGRPKDDGVSQFKPPTLPPLTRPKLPPGRILDVKQQSSSAKGINNKESEASSVIRPRNDNFVLRPDVSSSNGNVGSLEGSKGVVEEERNSDFEDCEDTLSDAVDTLSRSESFFMNCSLSGLSALDGSDLKMNARDPQARNFMIDRFLPAAKAMASETPQYAPRKQALVREPTGQVNRLDRNRQLMSQQYRPCIVPQHPQDEEEEDSEDEDEDYDDTGNLSAKACGILPRFCLKNSFCLLNPVSGMRIRSRLPLSPIARKANVQIKAASHGSSLSEIDDEHSWDPVFKYKLASELQPYGAHESWSKPTSESNQLTLWSDSQTPDGSSPYRRSPGDVISPYRNEAPRSPFHEGMGFLGTPKQGKNCRDGSIDTHGKGHDKFHGKLSSSSSQQASGSLSPTIEKTLYVDSVHMLDTPNSGSSSSNTLVLMNPVDDDTEILVQNEGLDRTPVLEARLGGVDQVDMLNETDRLQPKYSGVVVSEQPSSIFGGQTDITDGFQHKDGLHQKAKFFSCSKLPNNGSPDFDDSPPSKLEDQENSYSSDLQSPLPPPLPKSPSESWLWRTLPSVSPTNPSSRSYLGIQFRPRKQALKTSTTDDPKLETIVKTSYVHKGHELNVSQQSKT
ncbi:uncharacterized protein LOC143889270 isoform X2 [Tasmannia lanceolata]|uniref:uncharacterized protein LOC143889270 isoform X2 n=1 Tax=Tasmannia lanceolata TaxID=3420 RepID=UPI004063348A